LDGFSSQLQGQYKRAARPFVGIFSILGLVNRNGRHRTRQEDHHAEAPVDLRLPDCFCDQHRQRPTAGGSAGEIGGAGRHFDIILAKPKLGGAVMNFGNAPDALVIRLIGDELAVSFDSVEKMLEALDTLQLPVCAFHVESNDRRRQAPIAVYIVPKGDKVSTVEQ
jgi:hypothetical protein